MKMSRVIAVLILVAALVLPAHAACSAKGGGASGGQGSAYCDDDSREDQSRDRERDREQDREQEQEQEQEQQQEQQQEQKGEQEQDCQDDQEESQDEASPSPASREMAGYARALGFCEEFAATVDLQARVAGVDADRVRAMLQSMAQLTQRGCFPELVQGQAGPSDERPEGEGGSGDRDGQAWERLCSMLMELLRTRDQEWLRERLQECAAAGMTSLQAVELLARS